MGALGLKYTQQTFFYFVASVMFFLIFFVTNNKHGTVSSTMQGHAASLVSHTAVSASKGVIPKSLLQGMSRKNWVQLVESCQKTFARGLWFVSCMIRKTS
jgi:hypothetical protein